MKRVTGIGAMFFQANDPARLRNWYRVHLSVECEKDDGAIFKWRKADDPNLERYTVWSPFPEDTDYFALSTRPFMINPQVENLDEVLAQLKREGVDVDPRANLRLRQICLDGVPEGKPGRTLGTKTVVAAVSAAKEELN